MDTGQILPYDDFIKDFNANRMAAPIDTQFLFRKQEIESIDKAYQKVNVVVLSGTAGTGKTRLALHYAKNHAETHHEKLYCIHSNALPIYEDLRACINTPGEYFLIIDDANELAGLQHIIQYAVKQNKEYKVKILITVRDYASQRVCRDIRELVLFETVSINRFTDDEIKELIETTLGITNQSYHERIIRIAEGNARIAMLAGKIACETDRLESIDDVSQLYDDYYGAALEKHSFLAEDHLCVTAGVLAFLGAIHLDYIDSIMPLLEEQGLCRDRFIENVRKLHDLEIVDIYHDKAARISDQCLSNYLLKYVFFDKKSLGLAAMIKTCFQHDRERAIPSINVLLSIFKNRALHDFVQKELKMVWEDLARENSPHFFEFVKVSFRVNPTEALQILANKIEKEKIVVVDSLEYTAEERNRQNGIDDDIISILGGFADMADLPTALDLFFHYFLKRPDLYLQFYTAINQCFSIKKDSMKYGYYTQISLLEKIQEYSNNWEQEALTTLFLDIAKDFLKLDFSPAHSGRNNTIVICQIHLTICAGVEKYRGIIWQNLSILSQNEKHKERVRGVLASYGRPSKEISRPVMEFDMKHIQSIVESNYPPTDLRNCLLAHGLLVSFVRANISCESLFGKYFSEGKFQWYRLLKGAEVEKIGNREERKSKIASDIEKFVSLDGFQALAQLIDICSEISSLDDRSIYQVIGGLEIAFDVASDRPDFYVDAIRYYVEKNTPGNLHPCHLVSMLFRVLPDCEVLRLLTDNEYDQKNAWLYAYYHELPIELITDKHLEGLYGFLMDTSDQSVASSPFRDVDFLARYSALDADVFIKGCQIILSKRAYSPFIVRIYYELMFNSFRNSPQTVIKKFRGNLELLEEIYRAMLSYDGNHDYDGQFLNSLYAVKPSILERYIDYLVSDNICSFRDHAERLRFFFNQESFLEIYNHIFIQMVERCPYPTMFVPDILESILLPVQNRQALLEKQDAWFQQCIQLFSTDETKMVCLFSIISKLDSDRNRRYILLFLENNQSSDAFERIPLTRHRTLAGGALFLNILNGLNSLNHYSHTSQD